MAVFGDLYARDNAVFNQDLIAEIEAAGGEVVTTPYSDYAKIIAGAYFKRWFREGRYSIWLRNRLFLFLAELIEGRYYRPFDKYLGKPLHSADQGFEAVLARFHLRPEHSGESVENLLKIFHLIKVHPDISLFVQTNPAFCCPSLVTEAMAAPLESVTGVPIVTITYDGTGGKKNDLLVPYLKYAAILSRQKQRAEEKSSA